MAQIFSRKANARTRKGFVLAGLTIVFLALGLYWAQGSSLLTRQGERPPQPVAFSHKHHVQVLGIHCLYCHTSVERSSYAGIPPTKICMNCHAQVQSNAEALEPARQSWTTGQPIPWTRVHNLPGFVFFSHEIHVAKGVGCATCHGRVDQMAVMRSDASLQMQWCLDCHRNPAKNLRPTSEIYNMTWQQPTVAHPVWCTVANEQPGMPTSESVRCATQQPSPGGTGYAAFTSQDALGRFLAEHYRIRTAQELSSCEVCHR
ncbi:cytochrome c3 family protein [Telmatobacter bradus]|uniref:cytochrome c3 family protein n=1 Tax=Telmatobacter bradus TaxID=474953 RepID=UPI003B429107